MSLRNRLVVLLAVLLVLLAAADWWLVRSLTGDLSTELDRVAESVGQSVVNLFTTSSVHSSDSEAQPDMVIVTDPESGSYQFGFGGDDREEDDLPATGSSTTGIKIVVSDDGSTFDVRRTGEAEAIPVPREGVDRVLESFTRKLLLGSLGLVALALLAGAFMVHRETRPLQQLAGAARAVGEGELGVQANVRGTGEVSQAVAAFNQMSVRLRDLQNEALEHREREHLGELGEIARGLAHSLRNPLNTLGLSVDRLASSADESASRDLADTAREQIRRIDRTLKSILVLTTAETLESEPVDLRSLLRDVTLELLQADHSGVHIDVQDPTGTLTVRGLIPELRVMLQVILENAVQASAVGGSIQVELRERAGGGVQLVVSDHGPGLPDEVRRRLFSPHLTTKPHGAGMGLFLTHRLATRRYGGDLRFDDRPEGGTRVELQLADRLEEAHA